MLRPIRRASGVSSRGGVQKPLTLSEEGVVKELEKQVEDPRRRIEQGQAVEMAADDAHKEAEQGDSFRSYKMMYPGRGVRPRRRLSCFRRRVFRDHEDSFEERVNHVVVHIL